MSSVSSASTPRGSTPRRRRASIENVARITQLTEVQTELSVAQLTRLQKIFESYCSRGETQNNATLLSEGGFTTFCRDCQLVGVASRAEAGSMLTSAAANLLYIQKVKEAGDRGMCFDVFLEALAAMAQLRSNPSSRDELLRALQQLVEDRVLTFGAKHVRRMSVALAGGDVGGGGGGGGTPRGAGGGEGYGDDCDDGGLGLLIEQHAESSYAILDRSRELLSKPFDFHSASGPQGRYFRFEQFCKFAQAFGLLPSLFSRQQLSHMFRENAAGDPGSLDLRGFLRCLVLLGLAGFSRSHLADAYPLPEDKISALLEWLYASDGYEKIEEAARAEGCVGKASKLRRLSLATHKVQMEHSPAAVLSPSFARSPYEQAMGVRIKDQNYSGYNAASLSNGQSPRANERPAYFRASLPSPAGRSDTARGGSGSKIIAQTARRMSMTQDPLLDLKVISPGAEKRVRAERRQSLSSPMAGGGSPMAAGGGGGSPLGGGGGGARGFWKEVDAAGGRRDSGNNNANGGAAPPNVQVEQHLRRLSMTQSPRGLASGSGGGLAAVVAAALAPPTLAALAPPGTPAPPPPQGAEESFALQHPPGPRRESQGVSKGSFLNRFGGGGGSSAGLSGGAAGSSVSGSSGSSDSNAGDAADRSVPVLSRSPSELQRALGVGVGVSGGSGRVGGGVGGGGSGVGGGNGGGGGGGGGGDSGVSGVSGGGGGSHYHPRPSPAPPPRASPMRGAPARASPMRGTTVMSLRAGSRMPAHSPHMQSPAKPPVSMMRVPKKSAAASPGQPASLVRLGGAQ
jgi:hypothetical protein